MKRLWGIFLAVALVVNIWPATTAFAAEFENVQTESLDENDDNTEVIIEEKEQETELDDENVEELISEELISEDLNVEDNSPVVSENDETEEAEIAETASEEGTSDNTAAVEEGFVVSFSSFEGGKIIAYDRKDFEEAVVSENAESAIARNSDTGEIDTTGDGQVNFSVVIDEGYAFDSIEITEGTGNYKNLKTISEEGNVFTYRITKITGNLTVTVSAKKLDEEGARAKLIEGLEKAIASCPKYFEAYFTSETATVLRNLLDEVSAFDYAVVSDEEITSATERITEAIENLAYKTAEVPQVYISTENGEGNSLNKKTGYIDTDIAIVDSNGAVISDGGKIKVRGNSTANAEKKPYNIKLSSKQDVLGMGKAKKWCLLANCYDASLMRNATALTIAREMGVTYTSEAQYVELWIDGVFKGCYLLAEAIEAGKTRVDIDPDGDDFILEFEKSRVESGTTYITNANGLRFSFKEPEEPSAEKLASVQATLDRITAIIDSGDYAAVSEAIDIDSFARFYVFTEYIKNTDFNFSSVYFYYKDGVFYAGPAWDYDLSSGNARDSLPGLRLPNVAMASKCNWYPYLLKYSEFQKAVEEVFAEYSDYLQTIADDGGLIDATYAQYKAVFERNFGEAGWIVSKKYSNNQMTPFETLDENVEYFKNFLYSRFNWMNQFYRNLIPNVWVYSANTIEDGIVIKWREEADVEGYRVYRRVDKEWSPVSGVIQGNTFTDYTAEEGVEYYYDVVSIVNDKNGSLDYNGIPAKLDTKLETEFVVNKLPTDIVVSKANESAVFSVEATGKNVQFMWYAKVPGSNRFVKTGVNSPEYTRRIYAKLDGMQVYCVITDAYGHKVTTDAVSATIVKEFRILKDTEDVVVPRNGADATFSIDVQGEGVEYSWYYKKTEQSGGDGKFHKAGCYTNQYTVKASARTEGMQVYCVILNKDGKKLVGRTATLLVDKGKVEIQYPNGKEIEAELGKKASFKVETSSSDVKYSWYYMIPEESGGDGKFHKAGCYTNEYVRYAAKKIEGMQTYCVVTDSIGRLTKSDNIVLKIK
ncbi:MAG: CotH kinase family protein [Butyrivibrio sp.]|nr:CotH kinase family protein [Butyrivibrio sp.]